MKLKTNMEMMEMFNIISSHNLTPNQFYLLYCMKENIQSVHINIHQELRALESTQWIVGSKLTQKADILLQQVESFFKVQKKKTTDQVLGDDYSKYIEDYLLLFPKIKLPSGKAARSDKNNIATAFKWFFENYSYSWEIILKASAYYVDEFEKKGYLYMQTSQYFIRKQQSDKSWGSELANWCSIMEGGGPEVQEHFSEKVV